MKILIIGIVASGKTTLAKTLSRESGICHYEIDSIVHDDLNNRKRSIDEQLEIINHINKNKDWIIEGTLRKNLDVLLEFADKIIFIDNNSDTITLNFSLLSRTLLLSLIAYVVIPSVAINEK